MANSKVCLRYCIVLRCVGEKYMFANCGLQKIYYKLLPVADFCKERKKRRNHVYYHRLIERCGKNRYDG